MVFVSKVKRKKNQKKKRKKKIRTNIEQIEEMVACESISGTFVFWPKTENSWRKNRDQKRASMKNWVA